jgi:hypothetical protein
LETCSSVAGPTKRDTLTSDHILCLVNVIVHRSKGETDFMLVCCLSSGMFSLFPFLACIRQFEQTKVGLWDNLAVSLSGYPAPINF